MQRDKEQDRRIAIQRYLGGESPLAIWKSLGYSKQWFYKWLWRFHEGDEVAFELVTRHSVILRRADPHDFAYYLAVSETLGEWGSDADTEAFRNL